MEKLIRVVDEKTKTVQITTLDERWYGFEGKDKAGLPIWEYDPSITWIASYYPKGKEYLRWLANKGWDEAEIIKYESADRGSIVHHGFEKLNREGILRIDDLIPDKEGVERQMTPDEYYSIITASQWYEEAGRPKPLLIEHTVRSKLYKYAGTLDYLYSMPDGSILLLDIKTSKFIWKSHIIQLSALRQACNENGIHIDKMAVLQTNYTANKLKHYKFTEIEDKFDLFLSARNIWASENDGSKPFQRDYPLSISINLAPVSEAKATKATAKKKTPAKQK